MFKKIVLSAALASVMFAAGGFTGSNAQSATNQGGFVGKGALSASTVKQALALPDDARVVLEGNNPSHFFCKKISHF